MTGVAASLFGRTVVAATVVSCQRAIDDVLLHVPSPLFHLQLWKRALNNDELAGLHNASSSDAAVPFCPMKPPPPAPSCVGRAGLAQAYPVYPPFSDHCDAITDPFDTNVCTRADYGSAVRSDGYAMKTGSQFRTRTGTDGQDGFSYSFWARYGDQSGCACRNSNPRSSLPPPAMSRHVVSAGKSLT